MDLQPHKCLFEDPHPSPQSWTTYGDLLFSSKYTFFPLFSPVILARPNHLFYFPEALGSASTYSPIANRQCGSTHKPWLELPVPDEHLSCNSDIMCAFPSLFVLQGLGAVSQRALHLFWQQSILPCRPLGLRLPLPPLLLLVPSLPPHVPQLHSD